MITFGFICVGLSVLLLVSALLMLYRNKWVYNIRTEVSSIINKYNIKAIHDFFDVVGDDFSDDVVIDNELNKKQIPYPSMGSLKSYDYMMCHFWIWDIKKFIEDDRLLELYKDKA